MENHKPDNGIPGTTYSISHYSYDEFITNVINLIRKNAPTAFVRYGNFDYVQIGLINEENRRLLCLMRRKDLYICTFTSTDRMHIFNDIEGIPPASCYKLSCGSSYDSLLRGVSLEQMASWSKFTMSVESLIHGLKARDLDMKGIGPLQRHMAGVILVVAEGVRNIVVAKALKDSRRLGRYRVTDMLISCKRIVGII